MSDQTNPKDLIGVTKAPLHLVPPVLWAWVSQVFKFSAPKYGPFNWREKKVIRSIYLDAMGRHWLALLDGQEFDEESGLPHAAHIAANCAIYLDAQSLGNLVQDMQYPEGKVTTILAQLTARKETDGHFITGIVSHSVAERQGWGQSRTNPPGDRSVGPGYPRRGDDAISIGGTD